MVVIAENTGDKQFVLKRTNEKDHYSRFFFLCRNTGPRVCPEAPGNYYSSTFDVVKKLFFFNAFEDQLIFCVYDHKPVAYL